MRFGSAKSTIVTRNAGVTLAIISLANISEGKALTKVLTEQLKYCLPLTIREFQVTASSIFVKFVKEYNYCGSVYLQT